MKRFLTGLGLFAIGAAVFAQGDSVGVKQVNGVRHVVYKVGKGDNLGRISSRYGLDIAAVQKVNELEDTKIKVGQELLIPRPVKLKTGTHKVDKGQTLYAISRLYEMSVDEVVAMNQLESTDLSVGQELKVILPPGKTATASVDNVERGPASDEKIVNERPGVQPEKQLPEEETAKPVAVEAPADAQENETVKPVQQKEGFHLVGEGETLYSISRLYDCSIKDLKKVNRLDSEAIRPGMELELPKAATAEATPGYGEEERPAADSGGSSLIEMIANVSDDEKPRPQDGEEFPELEILKTDAENISPNAVKTRFKEKYTGKEFYKVSEKGTAGKIDDLSTDQTKFYGFHKYLPVGSYVRIDYPEMSQSILVEIVNTLPQEDTNIIRLSAKCRDYLMMKKENAEVNLRYVMPVK